MSAQPNLYFTLEEYYALENASDRRWEYWDGEVVCMSGSVEPHQTIVSNVLRYLFSATDGKRCRPYSEGQAVRAKTPSGYVYPDASVACDPHFTRHPERGIDILTNPIVIVEVTSPDSKLRDHNAKAEAYRINETLTDYIIIESDTIFVTHHQRSSGEWQKIAYSGMGDIIKATLQVELTIADLYVGVAFK